MGHSLHDLIRARNSQQYANLYEVDAYQRDPYHAKRVQVAEGMLIRRLRLGFPTKSLGELEVLEIGSATGAFAARLKQLGFEIIASDAEAAPLAAAEARGLKCRQFDASELFPFARDTFHGLFMGELIEHLFDTEQLLNECRRVLRPGGVLVLTTPNLATIQDRLRLLIGLSPRQVNPLHEYLSLHIRPFTASSMKIALGHCGFRNVEVKSNYVVWRFKRRRRWQSRLLAKVLPTLGGSLVIGASKPDNSCAA